MLFSFILMTTLFFAVLVTVLIIFAAFKFRRQSEKEVGDDVHGNNLLEVGWTLIPTIIAIGIFAWGAAIYVNYRVAPKDTLDIYLIGKQWMWKLQQPNGRKEINELHVPVNRNIKLIMGSEDVIHDFYVPAFRREDGRGAGPLQYDWFRPTKTGKYHFFLLAVLRNESRGEGRVGDRDGAGGVRGVAFRRDRGRESGFRGRTAIHAACVRYVPPLEWHWARAIAERGVWGERSSCGWFHSGRRRSVHPRIHSSA